MHIMCLDGTYDVRVPYCGARTISNLIVYIQSGDPEDYVDVRLSDENFPQSEEGGRLTRIELVSFNHWFGSKEDMIGRLKLGGYVSVNPAELLTLRAQHPRLRFGNSIVALAQRWSDHRNREWVPCLNSGAGNGLRLRTFDSGWAPFWKFAVKKAESV